jgi:hypothetical protein
MKKLILITVFITAIFTGKAQTSISIDTNYRLVSQAGYSPLLYDSLSTGDKTTWNSFVSMVRANSEKILKPIHVVTFLNTGSTFSKGTFTIIGFTGDGLFPVMLKVSDLTGDDLTLANQFNSLVQTIPPYSQLISCNAPFHAGHLTINGVVYNSDGIDSGSGGILTKLENMLLKYYNNQ